MKTTSPLQHESLNVNLAGKCWVEIQQLALIESRNSLHNEACNALGASDGVIHSRFSLEVVNLRASTNKPQSKGSIAFKTYVQQTMVQEEKCCKTL